MKSLLFFIVVGLSSTVFASEAKWVCMKDAKALEVKGATADAKKAACTTASGTWTEEKVKEKVKEKMEAADAGKGGSW